MANYEILGSSGAVVDTIVATQEFMERCFSPSEYRLREPVQVQPRTVFTQYEILRSFPQGALPAILELVDKSAEMRAWYIQFTLAKEINIADPSWLEGVAALQKLGILPADFAVE